MAERSYVIKSRRQLAALSSATRQEIVDVLSKMGTASVAALAETLQRPADALYYHLRALVQAGLVEAAGQRAVGKRSEALYKTPARQLTLGERWSAQEKQPGLRAIVDSMLRLGMRDHRAAMRGRFTPSGPQRDLWALRVAGWLSTDDVRRANVLVRELVDLFSKPKGPGRLYAATFLMTPLDHRRRTRRAPRKART